jgi:hypothetical protein
MGSVSPSISPTWSSLADCSKTILVGQNFTDLHVWNNGRTPRRMLKKSVQQGRSERRGEGVRFGTLSL